MKQTLLQIADDIVRSRASLESLGYSESEIEDNLLLVEEDLELKLAAYGEIIETCVMRERMENTVIENAETARIRAKMTTERLEKHIEAYLLSTGRTEATVGRFRYRLEAKGGKRAVNVACETESLPENLRVWKEPVEGYWQPDKTKIYGVLAAGEAVEGCELEPRPLVLKREVEA